MFAFIIARRHYWTENIKQLLPSKLVFVARIHGTKSTIVSFDLFTADVQSIKLTPNGTCTAFGVQSLFSVHSAGFHF